MGRPHTDGTLQYLPHGTEKGIRGVFPLWKRKGGRIYDEALAESDLEKSYELWKNAQWDGTSGITQDGDLPWIWLVNIDHLYWVKDGLQVAEQKLHPHGHGWSIVNNVDQWTWK